MPSMTLELTPNSPLHKRLMSRLQSRVQMAAASHNNQQQKWTDAEDTILAYVPETDVDALRRGKRENGVPQYTTIKIPYTYALLMSFHTYITSVFFARNPIHQFEGRHGEGEMNIQALEALIAYQATVGGMLAPYYIWVYDGGKYGVGILGSYWDKEVLQYGSIESIPGADGKEEKTYRSIQFDGYEGNRVYNVSPFDFMHDPRVTIGNFQKGEFCVVRKQIPWNEVLDRKNQGLFTNTEHIKGSGRETYDAASQPGSQLERPGKTSYQLQEWEGPDRMTTHPAIVHAYEVHVDLVPKEWGLGGSPYHEKWVFTITQDYTVILGATPLGLIHCKFPFDVMEIEPEAYGLYNRGLPETMEPIQRTMDWLINTHFFNTRAALNNQFVVDPSRVHLKDLEKGGPGLILRARPNAYGTPMKDAVFQLPVQDVTNLHMTDLERMFGIGEKASGLNEQMLGQLAGGGRKTATEVRTSTGFGVNRQKTIAEYLSATAFSSHAQKLVMTSQQYYSAEKKFRIVGDLARFSNQRFIDVSPASIIGMYDFVPVDGTLPVDRFAQATLWKELLSQLRAVPQVFAQYDMAKIFAWVAQLAGLKNIDQFRLQIASPESLALEAQRGNVVPISSGRGSPDAATQAGLSIPPSGVSPNV